MSGDEKPAVGSMAWTDLTVADAPGVRDFYAAVTGWTPAPVSMGEYTDYSMNEPGSGKSVAGVCHARGENADLPHQWLVYVVVANLDASLATCRSRGGGGRRSEGHGTRRAVCRHPRSGGRRAGAVPGALGGSDPAGGRPA